VALFARKKQAGLTVFFATDVHGSTLTFRKFLSAPTFYDADVLVLGGDLTGKRIVRARNGADPDPEAEDQLDGAYVVAGDAFAKAANGSEHELFTRLAIARLESWLPRAENVLERTGTPCFVIAGNDDPPEFVDLLKSHAGPWVRYCEERVLELGQGLLIGGCGWSNPTPWHTPREAPEHELEPLIRRILESVDPDQIVLDVHVPPHRVLDVCPELDTSVDPPRPVIRDGQVALSSVGSTVLRDLLLEYQPLAALCGHVHEARGATKLGRTFVVNPGSEYAEGVLRGALVRMRPGKILSHQLTSG